MYRTYENRTNRLVVFSVLKDVKGERRPKWYTVKPNESVEVELDSSELRGPNSWECAELFGLTLKKGSVQDIVKNEIPPEALAGMVPVVTIKKRGRKRKK